MSVPGQALLPTLQHLGRRLRRQEAHALITRSAWLPLALTALILLAARLVPLAGYRRWAWLPLLLWALAAGSVSLLRPLPPDVVARRTDRTLGLQERLTTALELGSGESVRAALFDRQLLARQRADALAVAATVDVGRAFPLRWKRRPLLLAGAGLLAALLLAALPNPLDQVLAERAAVQEVAAAEAEALAALAEEVATETELDPDEQRELVRALEEAAAALRANPGDREAALADVATLEDLARRGLDPQHGARQTALVGLAAELAELAGTPDADPSLEEAAHLLPELAAGVEEMEPDEREALAAALAAAAQQTAGSDPALAAALAQMAQSVSSGKPPLAQSTEAAVEAMTAAEAEAALQQSLAQALNQSQTAADSIVAAGQPGEAREGMASSTEFQGGARQQGQGSQPGDGSGGEGAGEAGRVDGGGESQQTGNEDSGADAGAAAGSGQGGQGEGQGQSMLGGGGGTTADSGPEARLSGRAGAPVKPNEAYASGELETVFAPWEQGAGGEMTVLPGRESGAGQETVREAQQPGAGSAAGARVPYSDVYAHYASTAAEAMEREYIPAGLKAYVRDYFTYLEP